jgi:hypothetical protein
VPLNTPIDLSIEFYHNYVQDLLVNKPDEKSQTMVQNYVFRDEQLGEYPYAIAFFMFRSGLHTEAIEYLRRSNHEDVKRFGEIYNEYFVRFNCSVPIEDL